MKTASNEVSMKIEVATDFLLTNSNINHSVGKQVSRLIFEVLGQKIVVGVTRIIDLEVSDYKYND